MMTYERIAFGLIGTPLQPPAESLRSLLGLKKRLQHPELREIYLEGKRTRQLLKQTITDDMNCIDVGCHLGSVLNEIVRLSPHGEHIAVEAMPYKADWLKKKYPRVSVHQIAVAAEPGTTEFFFNPRHSGFSGLRPHMEEEARLEKIQVECKRLDDVVPIGRKVGFLKIDIEGGELSALRGARSILHNSGPIVLFECTMSAISAYAFTPQNMFDFFSGEIAYDIYLLKDWLEGGEPLGFAQFEAAMKYPFQAFNFVAAPKSRGGT